MNRPHLPAYAGRDKSKGGSTERCFTEDSSDNLPLTMNNENGQASYEQKNEQGLIQEMISSKEEEEKHLCLPKS